MQGKCVNACFVSALAHSYGNTGTIQVEELQRMVEGMDKRMRTMYQLMLKMAKGGVRAPVSVSMYHVCYMYIHSAVDCKCALKIWHHTVNSTSVIIFVLYLQMLACVHICMTACIYPFFTGYS